MVGCCVKWGGAGGLTVPVRCFWQVAIPSLVSARACRGSNFPPPGPKCSFTSARAQFLVPHLYTWRRADRTAMQ